jgi:cell division cycle 2-like protein
MKEVKSRWADDADAAARQRKREEKKLFKLEKQKEREAAAALAAQDEAQHERAAKRQRLSPSRGPEIDTVPLLHFAAPGWGPCRHVDCFERLNHIEEGSYGSVYRAKEFVNLREFCRRKQIR